MAVYKRGDTWWVARLQLPGWEDCDVNELESLNKKSRYYTCRLTSLPTLGDADKAVGAIAAYTKFCLGPD